MTKMTPAAAVLRLQVPPVRLVPNPGARTSSWSIVEYQSWARYPLLGSHRQGAFRAPRGTPGTSDLLCGDSIGNGTPPGRASRPARPVEEGGSRGGRRANRGGLGRDPSRMAVPSHGAG